jgi:hypothetical protein
MARKAGVKHVGGETLRGLKAQMRKRPVSLAHSIAQRVGPEFTRQAREVFATGRDVYGHPRLTSEAQRNGQVSGDLLTLRDTGALWEELRFKASGSIVRCVLGVPYAKFLIGRYKILPIGDRTPMPPLWLQAVSRIAEQETDAYFGRRSA